MNNNATKPTLGAISLYPNVDINTNFLYSGNADGYIVYNEKTIRTKKTAAEVWFVAKDVCDILDIKQPTKAVENLNKDDVRITHFISKYGNDAQRKQEMLIVNESGLYSLIFQSRKSEAKAFQRWVTKDVLPMIREYGFYHPSVKFSAQEPPPADTSQAPETHIPSPMNTSVAVSHMLKELRSLLGDSDIKIVARHCHSSVMEALKVLDGTSTDPYMLKLFYARATGNQVVMEQFYTEKGATLVFEELHQLKQRREQRIRLLD